MLVFNSVNKNVPISFEEMMMYSFAQDAVLPTICNWDIASTAMALCKRLAQDI